MKNYQILALTLAVGLAGCKARSPGSETQFFHGTEIPATQLAAVVNLVIDIGQGYPRYCTGFFVSDSAVLTTGQCMLLDGEVSLGEVTGRSVTVQGGNGVAAQQVFVPKGLARGTASTNGAPDVAIVRFLSQTSKDSLKISAEELQTGKEYKSVGYGDNDLGPYASSKPFAKSYGSVFVDTISDANVYQSKNCYKADQNCFYSGGSDLGAPLLATDGGVAA